VKNDDAILPAIIVLRLHYLYDQPCASVDAKHS